MRYTFDRAGRLTQVREAGGTARVMKSFTYGTSGTSNGKLLTAVRNNYHDTPANVVITETYTYGGRQGRVSARTVAASSGASATFTQSFTWNELGQPATTGQPATIGYPACTTSPSTPVPVDIVGQSVDELSRLRGGLQSDRTLKYPDEVPPHRQIREDPRGVTLQFSHALSRALIVGDLQSLRHRGQVAVARP
jgi:hypothetical protein